MKTIIYKCPECEGVLDLTEGKDIKFCPYCGVGVEFVDEAWQVRKALIEADLRRDEMEHEKYTSKLNLVEKALQDETTQIHFMWILLMIFFLFHVL